MDMNSKQYTFSDFTKKTVINVCDGRELGHVCDLIFNNCGQILAIVVPGKKSLFKSLTSSENLTIPFNRIVKIGSDVILTDIVGMMAGACSTAQRQDGAYAQSVKQASYAPDGTYSPPYSDAPPVDGQAYSMAAEPMYRGENSYAPPPPTAPPRDDSSSARTYYHEE